MLLFKCVEGFDFPDGMLRLFYLISHCFARIYIIVTIKINPKIFFTTKL